MKNCQACKEIQRTYNKCISFKIEQNEKSIKQTKISTENEGKTVSGSILIQSGFIG